MKNRNIGSYKELQAALTELEADKIFHEELIKQNFGEIKEALKPINLVKSAIGSLLNSRRDHHDIVASGLGFGLKYLFEKLLHSNIKPIRNFATNIFEKLITSFV